MMNFGKRLLVEVYRTYHKPKDRKKYWLQPITNRSFFLNGVAKDCRAKGIIDKEAELSGKLHKYWPQFQGDDFGPLTRGRNTHDQLARYCGFKDYEHYTEIISAQPLDQDETNLILQCLFKKTKKQSTDGSGGLYPAEVRRSDRQLPPHFLSDEQVAEIEYGMKDIRVSCITCTLYWAEYFIRRKKKEIIERGNSFRYIVVEREERGWRNYQKIQAYLNEEGNEKLRKQIEIRFLFSLKEWEHAANGKIAFPISNDIVIYEKRHGLAVPIEWQLVKAIIGTKPFSKYITQDFSIEIEDGRDELIREWFEETWSAIGSTDANVDRTDLLQTSVQLPRKS